MADEKPKDVETSKPAEAAAEAARVVTEHTEHVETAAANAIETAHADAERANRAAAEIAGAAINTELGGRIETTRTEFETWRNQFSQRAETEFQKIPTLEKTVADLQSGLALLLGALKPENRSASTPPTSDDQSNPPLEVKPHEPGESREGQERPQVQQPQSTRKRHLL